MLNADFGRKINSETPVGLYIEIKDYSFYLERGFDPAEMLYNSLKEFNLHNIDAVTASNFPMIIQSFEEDSLFRFKDFSDLPLIQLMFWDHKGITYDINHIATYAHGVGPNSDYLQYWPQTRLARKRGPSPQAIDELSDFINVCHARQMAVHPYTFKDDHLTYTATPQTEAQFYVDKGVDGLFTEFPHSTLDMFTIMGTKSPFPENEDENIHFDWSGGSDPFDAMDKEVNKFQGPQ